MTEGRRKEGAMHERHALLREQVNTEVSIQRHHWQRHSVRL